MIHSRMLELMCTKNKVVTYPNMKYALNDLTKRLKQNEALPGLFLVSIDFRNTLEFIRFYQEIQPIQGFEGCKIVLVSCLADKKYFKPLTEAGIDLTIITKPLTAEKLARVID